MRKFLDIFFLYIRSLFAVWGSTGLSDKSKSFDRFGRRLGWEMICRGVGGGFSYIINPVSSFRYFEFPFALNSLTDNPGYCLDVSSPRLFSFYVAEKKHRPSIWMINPDLNDARHSAAIAKKMGYANIRVDSYDIGVLDDFQETFDAIWSISVIEHISGKYDDQYAVRAMYDALKSRGRLILTFPVDRYFWNEYREKDFYGLQKNDVNSKGYFFQRYYDKNAIWERLVEAVGVEPSVVRWFGEKKAGHFVQYEKKWAAEGLYCSVDDPVSIKKNYQEFSSWEMMPGKGVCGLMFEKTA